MNKEKIKDFVKNHKTEITVATGVVVGVVLFTIGKKRFGFSKMESIPTKNKVKDIEIPVNFAVGKIEELWSEGAYLNAIVEELTTDDIGKLGQEFVTRGLIQNGANVSMIVGFLNK